MTGLVWQERQNVNLWHWSKMEDEADILIIGAGTAGLAAARDLSAAGLEVIVLEAK